MSKKTHINDGFGNQVPMLDEAGNLSMEVIMLYAEDKLTTDDRKLIDAFVATDEMSKDALEGFMLTQNASKTRHTVNELNAAIQKRSGAKPVSKLYPQKKQTFDYRKLAAALAVLTVVAAASYFGAKVFTKNEVAEADSTDKVQTRLQAEEPVSRSRQVPLIDSVKTPTVVQDKTEEEIPPIAEEQLEPQFQDVAKTNDQTTVKEKKVEPIGSSKPVEKDDAESETIEIADKRNETELVESAKNGSDEEVLADSESLQQESVESLDVEAAAPKQVEANSVATGSIALEAENNARAARKAEDSEGLTTVDKPSSGARFPGGDIEMYKFIERKKEYPEALKQQGIAGTVKVSFDIDTNGRIVNPKITSSVNGILDADALRVIRSMPSWNPAQEGGKKVVSSRTVNVKYGD